MKGWSGKARIGILFIFLISESYSQKPGEPLVCLEKRCFRPVERFIEHTPQPEDTFMKTNHEFKELIHYINVSEDRMTAFDPFPQQASHYYQIINPNSLYFHRTFMDVPSSDQIWGTKPEFEVIRPTVTLLYFNKPKPSFAIHWNEEKKQGQRETLITRRKNSTPF